MAFLKSTILTLTLSSFCIYYSEAQNNTLNQSFSSASLIVETNRLLGLDDLLVNGKRYFPANSNVTGNPELEYTSTGATRLYIKGQCFDRVTLSLDIVSDLLIFSQSRGNGLQDRIELYPAFVDSFILGTLLFINPDNFRKQFPEPGYFEAIAGSPEIFLKKYRKTYLKIYDNENRGKYSPQKFYCYLMDKSDNLISVNSKRAFLRYYKVHKKAIKKYMQSEHLVYKKASNTEIRKLMTYCNALPDEVY